MMTMRQVVAIALFAMAGMQARADDSYQPLTFFQDWSDTGIIFANADWSNVAGMRGFSGSELTNGTAVDPRLLLAAGDGSGESVWANQANPSTFASGGLAEFHLANPVVAFQGSASADAPFLLIHLDARGWREIVVSYVLRDIDGSTDNSVQPVALQYRITDVGDFTNVAGGFVSDATAGPSAASLETPVSVLMPEAAWNVARLQLRIITTNATGNDEWVGIDDIRVTGTPVAAVPEPREWGLMLAGLMVMALAVRRRLRS